MFSTPGSKVGLPLENGEANSIQVPRTAEKERAPHTPASLSQNRGDDIANLADAEWLLETPLAREQQEASFTSDRKGKGKMTEERTIPVESDKEHGKKKKKKRDKKKANAEERERAKQERKARKKQQRKDTKSIQQSQSMPSDQIGHGIDADYMDAPANPVSATPTTSLSTQEGKKKEKKKKKNKEEKEREKQRRKERKRQKRQKRKEGMDGEGGKDKEDGEEGKKGKERKEEEKEKEGQSTQQSTNVSRSAPDATTKTSNNTSTPAKPQKISPFAKHANKRKNNLEGQLDALDHKAFKSKTNSKKLQSLRRLPKRRTWTFARDCNIRSSVENISMKRIECAVAQRVGIEQKACKNCLGENGAFKECVTIEGHFAGACANCKWNNKSKSCDYHRATRASSAGQKLGQGVKKSRRGVQSLAGGVNVYAVDVDDDWEDEYSEEEDGQYEEDPNKEDLDEEESSDNEVVEEALGEEDSDEEGWDEEGLDQAVSDEEDMEGILEEGWDEEVNGSLGQIDNNSDREHTDGNEHEDEDENSAGYVDRESDWEDSGEDINEDISDDL